MRIEEAAVTLREALWMSRSIHPEKNFIHFHGDSYTYADTDRLSNGFASYVSSLGIGKGDRACMLLPRVPELVIAFLGLSKLGVLPAPINYTLSAGEVERSIASADPSLALIHEKALKSVDVRGMKARGVRVIVVGQGGEGDIPWAEACRPSDAAPHDSITFDDIQYLNYTTGSSGDPKGAMATHENIYWNTRASVGAMEITGEDVHLCMFASFAHPHELFVRALYTGGSIVLLEEINPKTISRTINGHGVTCMMGLAPMYGMMASHCAHLKFPSLRIAESGGMYSRPDLIADFRRHFGIPMLSVWGSTETSGIALANTPGAHRLDGSAGRACPHYDVRLVDDDMDDVGVGEEGELAFRGRGVVSGYYRGEPMASLDGWYLSGDIARRDSEGYHYFIERKSGMLKVAGLKVYPLQVEIVLQGHEEIREVAVIGVEDRLRGVVAKAYVVRRDGSNLAEEDIKRYCKGRLAEYMIPKQVEFVGELPKIGSGKVNKKALKEMSKA